MFVHSTQQLNEIINFHLIIFQNLSKRAGNRHKGRP